MTSSNPKIILLLVSFINLINSFILPTKNATDDQNITLEFENGSFSLDEMNSHFFARRFHDDGNTIGLVKQLTLEAYHPQERYNRDYSTPDYNDYGFFETENPMVTEPPVVRNRCAPDKYYTAMKETLVLLLETPGMIIDTSAKPTQNLTNCFLQMEKQQGMVIFLAAAFPDKRTGPYIMDLCNITSHCIVEKDILLPTILSSGEFVRNLAMVVDRESDCISKKYNCLSIPEFSWLVRGSSAPSTAFHCDVSIFLVMLSLFCLE